MSIVASVERNKERGRAAPRRAAPPFPTSWDLGRGASRLLHVALLVMLADAGAAVDARLRASAPLAVEDVESALADVHDALEAHRARIDARRADMAAHAPHCPPAPRELTAALDALEARAAAAAASVGDVTAEIRRLDMAKRHVAHSIVTLRRLQMLGT